VLLKKNNILCPKVGSSIISNAKLISKFDTESDVFGRYSICLFPAIGLSTLNISEKSSH